MKLLLKEKVNEALAAVAPITLIVLCISVVLAPMQAGAMLLFLTLCIVAIVAARVVFPREVREELHEELEELKEHNHHTEGKKDGENE